jgi:hypothetical protein
MTPMNEVERNACEAARRDKELLKAGETIRFQAMNRRTVDRHTDRDVIVPIASSQIDVEGLVSLDDGAAHNSSSTRRLRKIEIDELSTAVDKSRAKKRKKKPDDLENILQFAEERRADQDSQRLKLETDRLDFDRERAAALDAKEDKRIELLSSQNELQRQQQRDNTMMQMKMMSVMEEMLRKLER